MLVLDNISATSPVSSLFGVGDKYAKLLKNKLNISKVEDLLNHFPQRYEDFSHIKKFENVKNGEIVTVFGEVTETKNIFTRSIKIQEIHIEDIAIEEKFSPNPSKPIKQFASQTAKLTFFNQPFILQTLKKGLKISVSGKAEKFGGKLQFKSPEYEIIKKPVQKIFIHEKINLDLVHTGRLIPVYSETNGISSKWLRARIYPLIQNIENLIEEFLPERILKEENIINLISAYKNIHYPKNNNELEKANLRLAFNELLLTYLFSLERKKAWGSIKGKKLEVNKFQKEIDNFITNLPFSLTNSQNKAIMEIFNDLKADTPMNRLLEGDVGSGKTIVAGIAMFLTYLNGFSSALMCPTEILANQHYNTINNILSKFNIPVELITSSTSNKNLTMKSPKHGIYIGTHALLEKKITIPDLNLVVIDEQHRFGVEQRAKLSQKGKHPHVLTMTATPIPRTIALTFYGDLNLSILGETPSKKQIKTWVVPAEKRQKAYAWIEKQIKETASQAFIICPFIEPSETMESIKSASLEFENLKKVFSSLHLKLLTGKTKPEEKNLIMKNFEQQKFDILVSTPVVEVGIDIPQASIMIIEGAERFGLAQLHQLRGRIGRRGQKSYCLLFASNENDEKSLNRLKHMETINNGLHLAEIDLKIRGIGNIFGTEQHGKLNFKKANINNLFLVEKAKNAAQKIINRLNNFPILKKKLKNSKISYIINN